MTEPRRYDPESARHGHAGEWCPPCYNAGMAERSAQGALLAALAATPPPPLDVERLAKHLDDANTTISMMREHLQRDHPDCAYDALGVLNDQSRREALLALTPTGDET